jgi:hypothetical protein
MQTEYENIKGFVLVSMILFMFSFEFGSFPVQLSYKIKSDIEAIGSIFLLYQYTKAFDF